MAGLRYQVIRAQKVFGKASAWSQRLTEVIHNGQEIKLRNLLTQEDDLPLDCFNSDGMTPLGLATQLGHVGMVKVLLEVRHLGRNLSFSYFCEDY